MTAESFDLAEKLQTPVILMTDLDLGMNDHVCPPLDWDEKREYKRGKVLTAEALDMKGKFGRYIDVDGDRITYRTIPATDETRGGFVTRGSSRDEYAIYSEDNVVYQRNMERLLRKWNTAKEIVPKPEFFLSEPGAVATGSPSEAVPVGSRDGVLFFGTSSYAAVEAIELLKEEGISLDAMRVRAFPFGKEFEDFIDAHEKVFVIEQNRDAQFKSLMMIELNINADKLVSVLNFDGTPITADNILKQISSFVNAIAS